MTFEEWVLACKAEGWSPALMAVRQSPDGTNEAKPLLVGTDPAWLDERYKGDDGVARFRRKLRLTWEGECISLGIAP